MTPTEESILYYMNRVNDHMNRWATASYLSLRSKTNSTFAAAGKQIEKDIQYCLSCALGLRYTRSALLAKKQAFSVIAKVSLLAETPNTVEIVPLTPEAKELLELYEELTLEKELSRD